MLFNSLSSDNFSVISTWKSLMILGLVFYLIFTSLSNNYYYPNCPSTNLAPLLKRKTPTNGSSSQTNSIDPPTNISDLVFGILGSERASRHRKAYIESWWRPNVTRGYIYLDKPPTRDLVPWSNNSPPYRVSKDLTKFFQETKAHNRNQIRIVHGIKVVFGEENDNFRWLVMGDDDTMFFMDNIVDVVAGYDHRKYYYLGGRSEFIMSNVGYSFNQGFGGAGYILSYPLAKALAQDMENCLKRYADFRSSDLIIMACIADIGVDLSPHKGLHQIDFRGDISGFLSSHANSPILSLHHFDVVDPIFPSMDRFESTHHLMRAANVDQSRLMRQTICRYRERNWTFSISWGYSAHIYERIMPRSYVLNPIETYKPWIGNQRPPHYMFNTKLSSKDPCEAPRVFSFEFIERRRTSEIFTSYSRKSAQGFLACSLNGNHGTNSIVKIGVISPTTKHKEMDRCECCDVVHVDSMKADIKLRKCTTTEEIIA